jgi:hypothetical protein
MAQAQVLTPTQISRITDQFQGTTYQPNSMDVQHEPLYDELIYAAGAAIPNLAQFFTSPAGKTLAQTNVQTAKKLDAPEAFAVKGIRFKIRENILLADAISLFDGNTGFCLEFWIGSKSYNRGPLWYYNAGGGVTATGGTVQSSINNGRTGEPDAHVLAINIVIDNQASFFGQLDGSSSFTLTTTSNGGTGAGLMMLLDGLHARGVQ